VIGAGFGRTGTLSLKVALDELGFGPCYHMSETAVNPGHVEDSVPSCVGEIGGGVGERESEMSSGC